MSIRAFSEKRTIPNFGCVSGGGTSNLQGGAIYAQTNVELTISDTTFKSNTASDDVSEISSIFWEKETSWHFLYACMSGGWDIQLAGRCYLCYEQCWVDYLQQHFHLERRLNGESIFGAVFWQFFDASSIFLRTLFAFSTAISAPIAMTHGAFDLGESDLLIAPLFVHFWRKELCCRFWETSAHPTFYMGVSWSILGGFGWNLDIR